MQPVKPSDTRPLPHAMDTAEVRATALALHDEAVTANERRLLVLTGDKMACYEAARSTCDTLDLETISVSDRPIAGDQFTPANADDLMGTTWECIILDCHDSCRPNTIGRTVGAVDGGGLLIFLTPDLDDWPSIRDEFDASLAVPPWKPPSVTGRFRKRLVSTLRAHRGIGIIDVDTDTVLDTGLTNPAPQLQPPPVTPPTEGATFPTAVYTACETTDQRDAVTACERLQEQDTAVVLKADRGRGKSSAAGLAAAALAATGYDIVVTAPGFRNAAEVFDRAAITLTSLDALHVDARDGDGAVELQTDTGSITFYQPDGAVEQSGDILIVDEAAALPVRILEDLLDVAPATCFATTVHGYEGTGRGFDIRFLDRVNAVRDVETIQLVEPIRYAAGDPIEVWVFNALLLNARPPASPLVTGRAPSTATYSRLSRDALRTDDHRLREVFGLLVTAHYQTEPDDLARLLDAPNIAIRALMHDDHIVSIALLAREGGLDAATRREAYEGGRIRGNMIPDLLTSQLRDPDAANPIGMRILRIATHPAVRSRGYGSRLITMIASEFTEDGSREDGGQFERVEYLGVGFGVTPDLIRFWNANTFEPVHFSTTRNVASGEYSAVMIRGLSTRGRTLQDRHTAWFLRRIPSVLADSLTDADPDIVRHLLASISGSFPCLDDITEMEWRLVASAAYGPGLYTIAPRPFRLLALRALVDGLLDDPGAERLLVAKVLQARPWDDVVVSLDYVSRRACRRALGSAFQPIVDQYGSAVAREEADRY